MCKDVILLKVEISVVEDGVNHCFVKKMHYNYILLFFVSTKSSRFFEYILCTFLCLSTKSIRFLNIYCGTHSMPGIVMKRINFVRTEVEHFIKYKRRNDHCAPESTY